MKSEKITFENSDGYTLSASLELPIDRNPHNFCIFAHCFTCSKNLRAVRNIADGLTNKGFGVLRFDFTGLGNSEGDFPSTNFSSQVSDLRSAYKYIESEFKAPSLMVGHSLGGTAVLMAASQFPLLKAVATIGSPAEPAHVQNLIRGDLDQITQSGQAEVSIGGRSFTIKKQFLDDLEKNSLQNRLKDLDKAILVLHSPQDKIVGIKEAEKIYTAAVHPKSFIGLDGADHLLTNDQDALYVGEVIAAWAYRYLDHPQKIELKTDKQTLVRLGEKEDKFTTQVQMGKHHLVADEPTSAGGYDYGPSPYDLLTASLGTCTAMTLRMYADRKGIQLEEVRVHLQHEKVHATDANAESQNGGNKIDRISRILELDGDLTEKQRQRMLEIADKCPVHKTLTRSVSIESKLMDTEK